MAFYNLRCRRLFIYLPLMLVLCSMTSGRDHNNSPSPSEHKRTVALNKATERFLALIFEDYSDNSTRRISASRFNDILKELNLGEVTSAEQSTEDKPNEYHTHEHRPVKQPSLRNSRRKGPSKDAQNSQNFQDREQRKVHENRHEQRKQRCLKEQDLLRIHQVSETKGVSQEDFVRICPSLVHQLLEGACIEVQESESEDEENTDPKMLQVWGYGVLSITVISLTSLLAIGIIPLMGRSIYKKIMSFLVALAVGTLSGDALLHLIPHAFDSNHTGDSDKSDGHKINVYKSCVIMAGIYVFFMVECAMKARLGRRKQTQHNMHVCDDVTTPDEMSLKEKKKCAKEYQAMVGSRLAGTHRCISYDDAHFPKVSGPLSQTYKPSSCELVIVEPAKEVRTSNTPESSQEKVPLWEPSCHGHHCYQRDSMSEASKHSYSDTELISALYGKSCIHPNLYINEKFAGNASDSSSQTNRGVSQGHCHRGHGYRYQVTSVTTDTSTDDAASESGDQHYEENHNHHHHHHHHSHKIDKNTSIATVAWMVIVGDGFHNFSDGLAVGAAFSTSLTSGLTTAIAVFCHELPHELGDFAILLKSGLTFRQAVAYNFASAIISYIGLVLGIIIGDMESAHSWVLALTAGMFLYISLVDMLPELSNFLEEGGGLSVVLSQNIGILTGVAIMLVIALYET